MELIVDKIYELVVKSENFEFAFDIHQRFEDIKERLCEEFWRDLKDSISNEFGIYSIYEYEDESWGFNVKQKDLKNFIIYFECNDSYIIEFGVGTNIKKNYKDINSKLEDILNVEEKYELKKCEDSTGIWFRKKLDQDFSTISGLKNILPENKKSLINEYTNTFRTFVNELKDDIKKLDKKLLNK